VIWNNIIPTPRIRVQIYEDEQGEQESDTTGGQESDIETGPKGGPYVREWSMLSCYGNS
jgi:hypothetical protein